MDRQFGPSITKECSGTIESHSLGNKVLLLVRTVACPESSRTRKDVAVDSDRASPRRWRPPKLPEEIRESYTKVSGEYRPVFDTLRSFNDSSSRSYRWFRHNPTLSLRDSWSRNCDSPESSTESWFQGDWNRPGGRDSCPSRRETLKK